MNKSLIKLMASLIKLMVSLLKPILFKLQAGFSVFVEGQ